MRVNENIFHDTMRTISVLTRGEPFDSTRRLKNDSTSEELNHIDERDERSQQHHHESGPPIRKITVLIQNDAYHAAMYADISTDHRKKNEIIISGLEIITCGGVFLFCLHYIPTYPHRSSTPPPYPSSLALLASLIIISSHPIQAVKYLLASRSNAPSTCTSP